MDLKTEAFNADIEGEIMDGRMGASETVEQTLQNKLLDSNITADRGTPKGQHERGKAWSSQRQGTKGTASRNRHTADCTNDIDTSL
jgi:hypothetical protein